MNLAKQHPLVIAGGIVGLVVAGIWAASKYKASTASSGLAVPSNGGGAPPSATPVDMG